MRTTGGTEEVVIKLGGDRAHDGHHRSQVKRSRPISADTFALAMGRELDAGVVAMVGPERDRIYLVAPAQVGVVVVGVLWVRRCNRGAL